MRNQIKPLQFVSILVVLLFSFACNSAKHDQDIGESYADVNIVSAMKKVMWSGELQGKIDLDTITNKSGLQGIGPQSHLTGEILVLDGKSYVSKVLTDSTMSVTETYQTKAPFFVYSRVNEWQAIKIPDAVKDIKSLEKFVNERTTNAKRPFAFKVVGKINNAIIHIQNLPKGTQVSSPKEAHQGQVNYQLNQEDVEILGFFSTEHQRVFTHHDTFMHLHLITQDRTKMGHLDNAEFGNITLYLPVR